MKILWIHNWPEERKNMGPFMWTVYDGLKESGHQIDMYYLDGKKGLFELFREFIKLKKISKNYQFIHSQYGSLVGYFGSKLGLPHIITVRGSDWHRYKGKNLKEYLHSLIATWLTRRAIRQSIHAIVMSKRMAKELTTYHSKISVATIPDPIDISLFKPMNRNDCRAKLGYKDENSKWILFNTISENNPVKRQFLARAAIDIVKKVYPEVKLKIATGIKYDEMPFFINSCDLALCTSTHEGWPNSIKEALACNLPFVSTDVSDLRDISLAYKSCKITNDNPEEIARAIIEVLSTKEKESYYFAAKKFDLNSSIKKYISIYNYIEKNGALNPHLK